ncbi:MAG TPA: phosphopantetheine-binding protein, partial [Elusimicrobiales bacterium]|nr:phosphopantetheine-binding protein [Elusimicrobiales bacterium]
LELAKALARLASLGVNIDLKKWEDAPLDAPEPKGGFVVPLTGANYRAQRPAPPLPRLDAPPAQAMHYPAAQQAQPAPFIPSAGTSDQLGSLQDSMNRLAAMQEQAALLHAKFLESQEQAQRSLQALIEQQQRLAAGQPVQLTPALSVPQPQPVAARPVPAPQTPKPAQAAHTGVSANVEKTLIEIVSKQTGYPVEALKPGMDMESDLGIDSIKRVAILAEVQEKLPSAPQIKPEHLGTMRTLKQVAEYLSQGAAQTAPPTETAPTAAVSANVEKTLIEIVSKQTGYPVEALKPGMDMESDLGIDSIKRVAILAEVQEKLPSAPQIKPEHLGTMRTLKQVAEYLSQGAAQPSAIMTPQVVLSAPVSQLSSGAETVEKTLIEIVSKQTGYPVEALKPGMDMESDLGIDSIKRVAILAEVQERLPSAP